MNGLDHASEVVVLAGEHVMTDSRTVAKSFGKPHRSVLRAYRNLECSEGFRLHNFVQCLEINGLANGKPEPVIQMTKDGFMFLVMGFTGKEAAKAKEAFIAAFNEMAEFIQSQANAALKHWEVAYLEYRHDQDHASRCGRDLSVWRSRKLVHLARLESLDPQIKLPLIGREAA
ncbi:Rha family transcriptional regulator [Stenotrophomonas maltophilia]|uniref:Rha family transcriptional regulator n=1 Tax=Stenotrophomonas maltophilia TaxID=40324 RepID=UPI0013DAD6DF|nr:Rha family transcriptional regulator [Stenotrophomonas maltophilia]